jgi:two-component system chemotaxis response regulator CheB
MSEVVRILIVDDSAYVRKVIRQMLSRSPFLEIVGTARDGREALELAEELQPDVITCDLIMPELDGVGFIKAQLARRPVPIVVVAWRASRGAGARRARCRRGRFRAKADGAGDRPCWRSPTQS